MGPFFLNCVFNTDNQFVALNEKSWNQSIECKWANEHALAESGSYINLYFTCYKWLFMNEI